MNVPVIQSSDHQVYLHWNSTPKTSNPRHSMYLSFYLKRPQTQHVTVTTCLHSEAPIGRRQLTVAMLAKLGTSGFKSITTLEPIPKSWESKAYRSNKCLGNCESSKTADCDQVDDAGWSWWDQWSLVQLSTIHPECSSYWRNALCSDAYKRGKIFCKNCIFFFASPLLGKYGVKQLD